jgi:phosphotransferase system  glucose/maltose/N-acetylglucosamine-specific IIC component
VAADHLPAPWCYVVAVMAAALAFALIAVLENRREGAMSASG